MARLVSPHPPRGRLTHLMMSIPSTVVLPGGKFFLFIMALNCTLLPHFTGVAAMPVIGLGVYQNPNCKPACLAALQSGYRSVPRPTLPHCSPPPSNLRCKIRRHIDSARAYRNEAQVGDAVRESGVPCEDIFISPCYAIPGPGGI